MGKVIHIFFEVCLFGNMHKSAEMNLEAVEKCN